MALNISAIQDELKPGLAAVEGRYKMVPLELQDVFTTRQSYMNQEFTTYMRHPGVAAIKVDGQSVVYDNQSGQRYKYNMRPIGAGLGYIMTRNFLADNLYRSEFDPMNLGLQDSMREFWNIQSAYLFNTATTYDTSSGGTGQPLLSVSHPTDAGTFANTSSTPQSPNPAVARSSSTPGSADRPRLRRIAPAVPARQCRSDHRSRCRRRRPAARCREPMASSS